MPKMTHRFHIGTTAGFLLAAGEGRRLRPLTFEHPKALVPFCGVPLLQLALQQLHELNLPTTVINACWHARQIQRAVQAWRPHCTSRLRVSTESLLLGTGGGLRRGVRLAGTAEHILVHNADVVADFSLPAFVNDYVASGADALLLMIEGKGDLTVELAPNGRILDFRRPKGTGTHTFAGIHLLHRSLLELLPPQDPCSIVDAYETALAQGRKIIGATLAPDAFWSDLGTLPNYIRAHHDAVHHHFRHHRAAQAACAEQGRRRRQLDAAGVACSGAAGLGRNLQVPAGSRLHNCVLWDRVHLTAPLMRTETVLTGKKTISPLRPRPALNMDPRIPLLLDCSPRQLTVVPLRTQGSGRSYYRLKTDKDTSWILCTVADDRQENALFPAATAFLARIGLRVPAVLHYLPETGQLVIRDLGDTALHDLTAPDAVDAALCGVAVQAARLHSAGLPLAAQEDLPLQPGFDPALYQWEADYCRGNLLDFHLHSPQLWSEQVQEEHSRLLKILLNEPPALIHRDLQSANILIFAGEPWLIDYQGMRRGAAAYDIASLLFDPYMQHPADRRRRVWHCYQAEMQRLGGHVPSASALAAAAVQRLLQALGAYVKLGFRDNLPWYRRHIVPGLRMLQAALADTPDEWPAFRTMTAALLDMTR
jgi:NDP-sugar pyrophosphorylase family protein/aminoglycoside/choline kinase family phosphotransferase